MGLRITLFSRRTAVSWSQRVDLLIVHVDVDIVASHIAWQRLNLRPCILIITTATARIKPRCVLHVLANALFQYQAACTLVVLNFYPAVGIWWWEWGRVDCIE